jgi:hypothetical protein
MGASSVSSGSSQASAASASSAQTIQNSSQSQSLDSVVADLADSAAAKSGELKPYLLSSKLVEAEKQSNFYKKEPNKEAEAETKSEEQKKARIKQLSTSKLFHGTAEPLDKDDKTPVNLSNGTGFLVALFSDSFASIAYNSGMLKSFARSMMERLFGNGYVSV